MTVWNVEVEFHSFLTWSCTNVSEKRHFFSKGNKSKLITEIYKWNKNLNNKYDAFIIIWAVAKIRNSLISSQVNKSLQ